MKKRIKRIAAMLLALTLIWQPSWSSIAKTVQAEENEETVQGIEGSQADDVGDNSTEVVQVSQEDRERALAAQQEEEKRIEEQQKAEQEKEQREAEVRRDQTETQAEVKQNTPEANVSIDEFKGVRVTGMEISDDDHEILAGESFDVLLTLANTLDEDVSVLPGITWQNPEWELGYTCQPSEQTLLRTGTEETITVTVDVPVYEKADSWTLYMVSCDIYTTDGEWITSLGYDPNLDYFYWNDEKITGEAVYVYDGNVDYTVINEGVADLEAPSVTKVTFADGTTDTTTGTLEELTVKVHYKEDVSGVSWLHLAFRNDADEYDREEFDLYEGTVDSGVYTGEGIIEISSKQLRTYGGRYTLESVTIGDCAGNAVNYLLNENGDLTIDGESDSAPVFERASYTVDHRSELPYVLIEEMELTDNDGNPVDKDNIVAGDPLNLAVTLVNKSNEYVQIDGWAEWTRAEDSGRRLSCYSDEYLYLQPGESGMLIIPVNNNKYSAEATWDFDLFYYHLYSVDGTHIGYASYMPESENRDAEYYYSRDDGEWLYLPLEDTYSYSGEGDFVIAEALNPDEKAPEIEKITIMDDTAVSGEIGNFDNLKVKVHYNEDISGIQSINLTFRTESGEEEYISFYGEDADEGVYTGRAVMDVSSIQLRSIDDTYKLVYADIYDYAGNRREYEAVDGMIRESGSEDGGFTQPSYSVTRKTELKGVMFAGMQLVDASGQPADNTNVEAGEVLNLAVTLDNSTDMDVSVSGSAGWVSEKNGISTSYSNGSEQSVEIKAGESGVMIIPITNSKYSAVREWKLEYIDYNISQGVSYLGFGRYDHNSWGESYGYQMNDEYMNIPTELWKFANTGQMDYDITYAPEADETAPVITGVTLMDENVLNAEIGTTDLVSAYVAYKEEGAGIESLQLSFADSEGKTELFTLNDSEEEKYKDSNGIIVLEKGMLRSIGSEYKLEYLYVNDYAGNVVTYNIGDDGKLQADNGSNTFAQPSYKVVQESDNEMFLPVSIWLETEDGTILDKNEVAAGDSLVFVMKVNNKMRRDVTVDATLRWSGDSRYIEGTDVLKAGEENGEIRIPFKVSEFADVGTYMLESANLYVQDSSNGEYVGTLGINPEWDQNYWSDGSVNTIEFSNSDYENKGNYSVVSVLTPDTEAPHVYSIGLNTDPVKAPGRLQLAFETETGAAGITNIMISLEDMDQTRNTVHPEVEDMYYSPQQDRYILDVLLPEDTFVGKYRLGTLSVYDEAGRSREYYTNGEKLMDYEGNSFDNITVEITEGVENRDFDPPQITDIKIDKKLVNTPGKIKYTVEAMDPSGINNLLLTYRNQLTKEYLYYTVPVENVSGNVWEGTIEIGKYARPGQYELLSLDIYDNSPANNRWSAAKVEGTLTFTELDFEVTSEYAESFIRVDGTELDQLTEVSHGGTAIFYSTAGFVEVSKEVMSVIREKKLSAIFVSGNSNAEVIVDGSELTEKMAESWLHVTVDIGSVYRYENGVVKFANGYDKIAQNVHMSVLSSAKTEEPIPYTARLKIDDQLLAVAKETGVSHFSKFDYPYSRIIEENLKFTEDGYYEISSASSLNATEYYISSETVKNFDYPLTVTATPSFTSDIITKGSSFDVELSVTNPNENVLNNIAVFTMINTEEAPECDWCTFESDDSVVITVDNGAVISELAPAQTVKLTAKFTVPEDTDYERVPLLFVATSISEDETKIVSYGDDELRITLQDKMLLQKGDINADGIVNSGDLAYMLQVVNKRIDVESLTQDQIAAGDVNSSAGEAKGTINSGDLSKLLQFVNGRISSLD